MQTIIDEELAEKLAREGYFYIMHRFLNQNVMYGLCKAQRTTLIYILLFPLVKTRRICFS